MQSVDRNGKQKRHDVEVAFRRGHPNASQVAVNVPMRMDSDIRCVHRDGAGFPLSYKISHEVVESGDEFVVGWIWHQSDMPEDKPLLMHSCCVTDGLNEIQLNAERIGHSLAVLEALWFQGRCKMQTLQSATVSSSSTLARFSSGIPPRGLTLPFLRSHALEMCLTSTSVLELTIAERARS